ncbi:hypothetical protein BC938DRAFT_471305 [Jimgerdemannia flammicorona]|uniref:F-box domain-containing protein n=1 Tax=Jimgerdemannia flammicorona TaxID=994334 RepID=A0A433Q8C9_9FUNG|nr:hypothetical protein BC938DRAFT_471305 [Jimgerdemannia flammicorona]
MSTDDRHPPILHTPPEIIKGIANHLGFVDLLRCLHVTRNFRAEAIVHLRIRYTFDFSPSYAGICTQYHLDICRALRVFAITRDQMTYDDATIFLIHLTNRLPLSHHSSGGISISAAMALVQSMVLFSEWQHNDMPSESRTASWYIKCSIRNTRFSISLYRHARNGYHHLIYDKHVIDDYLPAWSEFVNNLNPACSGTETCLKCHNMQLFISVYKFRALQIGYIKQ